MDKNFIKIDDLVRQRLSGREEQEPSGAWLRMSELLDKEMPRVRPAGFIWRRMFGALAILALIGAFSLGGYELNTYLKTQGGNNDAAIAAASVADHANTTAANTESNPVVSNTNADNDDESNTEVKPGVVPGASEKHKQTNNQKQINNNDAGKPANNKTGDNRSISQKIASATVKHTTATHETNNNVQGAERNTTAKSIAANKKTTASENSRTEKNKAGTQESKTNTTETVAQNNIVPAATVDHKTVAADKETATAVKKTTTGNNTRSATSPTAPGNATTTGGTDPVAKTTAAKTTATRTTATNPSVAKTGAVAKTTTAGTTTTTPSVAETSPVATTAVAKTKEPATGRGKNNTTGATTGSTTNEAPVAKSGNSGNKIAGVEKTPAKKAGNNTKSKPTAVSVNNLAISSSAPKAVADKKAPLDNVVVSTKTEAPAGKKTIGERLAGTGKTGTASNTLPVGPSKMIVSSGTSVGKPAATTVPGAKTSAKTASVATAKPQPVTTFNGNTKTSATPAVAKKGAKSSGPLVVADPKKNKRVIDRMIIHQRFLKTANKETNFRLDTISMEMITEEYEIANTQGGNTPGNGANKTATEVAAVDDNKDSSPIVPAGSTLSKSSESSNENILSNRADGGKTIENLSAAFNDIKYNAGRVQFHTGITAGINATFFGPNNFKGFQFGLSGQLTFGESLSLMSDLKYFHRINNDFAVRDDYYTYTPVTGGGYSREMVSNPYNVSTLHSIEMPISLRYHVKNFNFFFGPNLSYTFAINTGNYPMTVASPTPNIVSAPGNDNTPLLKAGDFNSRFGVGYLFGVSFQVAPRVMIDIRDVQTFWDNASTPGAKYISTKLYKSPSFQLSIGYRLGGNKNKDR